MPFWSEDTGSVGGASIMVSSKDGLLRIGFPRPRRGELSCGGKDQIRPCGEGCDCGLGSGWGEG